MKTQTEEKYVKDRIMWIGKSFLWEEYKLT